MVLAQLRHLQAASTASGVSSCWSEVGDLMWRRSPVVLFASAMQLELLNGTAEHKEARLQLAMPCVWCGDGVQTLATRVALCMHATSAYTSLLNLTA